MQSVGQKKTKTFHESCNATITRVLNTSGANYKINLNRESAGYIYIYIYILGDALHKAADILQLSKPIQIR